jgi:hypothetical protein
MEATAVYFVMKCCREGQSFVTTQDWQSEFVCNHNRKENKTYHNNSVAIVVVVVIVGERQIVCHAWRCLQRLNIPTRSHIQPPQFENTQNASSFTILSTNDNTLTLHRHSHTPTRHAYTGFARIHPPIIIIIILLTPPHRTDQWRS